MDKSIINDECREELNESSFAAPDVPEAGISMSGPCAARPSTGGLGDVLHPEQPQHDRLPEVCSNGELPPGS